MGRPINKDKIGYGSGRIAVTRHFFTGGAEATTAAHIVRQAGNGKYVVRLDSNATGTFLPRTDSNDEVLTLVNKAGTGGGEALVAGEFTIDAVGSDSTTYQVTKLRNRSVQLEAGGTEVNAIYNIGYDASAREISGHPNANLSVALPGQA
jgi:hypothetical protein